MNAVPKPSPLGPGITEILGLFLIVAGVVALVAAAALVSTALAVAVAGFAAVLTGVLAVYVANVLEQRAAAAHRAAVERAES